MKIIRISIVWGKVIGESINFAFQSIKANRLRTFLSLFGITIGIFAIISVFTILDSLEKNVRDSLESLGDNVVYVQKWPWNSGSVPWWKFMNRPQPTLDDLHAIRQRSMLAHSSAVMLNFSATLKYKSNTLPYAGIVSVTDQFEDIRSFEVAEGRYFSTLDIAAGRRVVVLGAKLANDLFEGQNPVGEILNMRGHKVEVIGVLEKEGTSMLGDESNDELAIIPISFARVFINPRLSHVNVMVKAKDGVPVEELIDELRGILRTSRKLRPIEEDNFALNQISQFKEAFDTIFRSIHLGGWIIGGFAILVGGFGIANIMFVSVRERINIIGIQKALGAKNFFILLQFLFESVLLSVVGGAIGLLLVFLITLAVSSFTDFQIYLTLNNIILGLSVSAIIGIVSGYAPARQASRLNPVQAISTNA